MQFEMNKKIVNPRHPTLFNEPVEITHALVAVASQEGCDGLDYDLMMEAANHIRALEATVDFLHGELIKREEIINKIPYGSYSHNTIARQEDYFVTRSHLIT
jgi:hypothetical protein